MSIQERGVKGQPNDRVTVSAKVPRKVQDQLDDIGKALGESGRSNVIRMGLDHFIKEFNSGRVPLVYEVSRTRDSDGRILTEVSVYHGIRGEDQGHNQKRGSEP